MISAAVANSVPLDRSGRPTLPRERGYCARLEHRRGGFNVLAGTLFSPAEAVAVALDGEDVGVMDDAVDEGGCPRPALKRGSDHVATTFREHLRAAGVDRPRLEADNASEERVDFRSLREAGQFVFANDLNVSVEWTSHVGVDSTSLTTLLGGSVEYFVVDHLAIGVSVGISSASVKGIDGTSGAPVSTSTTALTFAPLVAADLPIGRFFSLFPRLSLSIGHERYDEISGSSENSTTDDVVAVGLYVALLVHPAPHVFVGFGPSGNHELSHAVSYPNDPLVPAVQNRETTWGAGLVVGGWL
jgi:hypothetical protein